jgi:hypothetical protein
MHQQSCATAYLVPVTHHQGGGTLVLSVAQVAVFSRDLADRTTWL